MEDSNVIKKDDNILDALNLGVKQVPANEAINGGTQPLATAKPILNYPRNEELIVQSVIYSEEQGYALLRALQLVTNTFGADTIIKLVDKLEKNPKLADKAIKAIPMLLMM